MKPLAEWLRNTHCLECNEVGTLRPILYGEPTMEAAESGDWMIGGCLISEIPDTHGCLGCGWTGRFKRGKLVTASDEFIHNL
ncbi:MAG: hypothetical protein WCO64_03970 [Actinomycetes bacterium]